METKVPSQQPVDGLKPWAGYTLDDLRYRRAVNQVKMEMERERFMARTTKIVNRQQNMFGGGVVKKIFTGFSILDYAMLAIQTGKQIRKIYRFFRK